MKLKLEAQTIEIKKVKPHELERMYEFFSEYYLNHDIEVFKKDLSEKDHVILLRDSRKKTIQGFSTLLRVTIENDGKKLLAFIVATLFSTRITGAHQHLELSF